MATIASSRYSGAFEKTNQSGQGIPMDKGKHYANPFPDYGSMSYGISIGALALGAIISRVLGLDGPTESPPQNTIERNPSQNYCRDDRPARSR